jgi:glutaredoxin
VRVELYGTSGCHLCGMAKDILRLADIAYTPVDVADSDALLEK